MKVFLIQLLSITFVLLITGSIQSVTADHLEPGQGIFKNEREIEVVPIQDSNYQIYLQTVLRNGDGQMISVAEGMHGFVIPHQISDHVFDTLMGKKEIVTIDNIKYEKVQYTFSPTLEQRTMGMYPIFAETNFKFKMEGDALAQMNEEYKDYSIWKIHYCATFEGHGYSCIPIFQVLVSTMTLEPHDVITQQWTILRELN
jgi:hypothetical protein